MPEKEKKTVGQFTHWARPRWIRMYDYNYQYGESYYRPQVRYVSTSRYSAEATSSSVDIRRAYLARRRALSPPRAQSYIERWHSDPFYGYGFRGEETRSSRARSELRASSELRSSSQEAELSHSSRRAQSELRSSANYSSSNYASKSLLNQINTSRATSAVVQQESQEYQHQLHRRARSISVARDASYASDDCLMRSTAVDAQRSSSLARSVRAQSYSSEMDISQSSRYAREGSLTRNTLSVDENNVLKGKTLDGMYDYEYPRHHLVCSEKCPLFNDPVHHRRFVIGNKFGDAAALGGFDVLYDPSVYKKTRALLQRFSQERTMESTIRESSLERETESQSRGSRYISRTIY